MVQGELFIEENNVGFRNASTTSFFGRNQLVLTLDKIILIVIAFVVLFVLTYSFGYERGYRSAEQKIQTMTAHIETIVPAQNIPTTTTLPVAKNQTQATKEEAVLTSDNPEVKDQAASDFKLKINNQTPKSTEESGSNPGGKYTIQVATVLSKDKAQKEVVRLGSAGTFELKPFFVQRGRYYEVCVGSFGSVASAKPILTEFRSKGVYSDAFVRPNSNT